MSSDDLASAVHRVFEQHLAERDFWPGVVETVKAELATTMRRLRISGKVEGRPKSTGSVVGKTMRKPDRYGDLAQFGDLAAARALVPFPSDVEPFASEIHRHPGFSVLEDDIKRRSPQMLHYQARHMELEVDWSYFRPGETPPRPVRCELQIQTLAESLWASTSHLVTYKRDNLPDDVQLRVNRLIVLCELFDAEIEAARDLALQNVDLVALIANDLDRYFTGITGSPTGPGTSLEVIGQLIEALEPDEHDTYAAELERFVSTFGDRLVHLLTLNPEARGNPWFLRPEAIFALERLTTRPNRFAVVWDRVLSSTDREQLAAAWGPIDS